MSKAAMLNRTVSASSSKYTLIRGRNTEMNTNVMRTIIPAFRSTLRSFGWSEALKFLTTMATCAIGFATDFIVMSIGNVNYCIFCQRKSAK